MISPCVVRTFTRSPTSAGGRAASFAGGVAAGCLRAGEDGSGGGPGRVQKALCSLPPPGRRGQQDRPGLGRRGPARAGPGGGGSGAVAWIEGGGGDKPGGWRSSRISRWSGVEGASESRVRQREALRERTCLTVRESAGMKNQGCRRCLWKRTDRRLSRPPGLEHRRMFWCGRERARSPPDVRLGQGKGAGPRRRFRNPHHPAPRVFVLTRQRYMSAVM